MFESFDRQLSYIPGGIDLDPMILRAMIRRHVNPWNTDFIEYYEETLDLLKKLFQTKEDVVVMMGPIRAAMDTVVCSLVEPGDRILVAVNGYWSELFVELVNTYRGVPIILEEKWGSPIDSEKLSEKLDELGDEVKAVIATHVETSTGVVNPVNDLGSVVKKRGLLFVVDAAQTLGGMEMKMDDWGVDLCISGNHKCMSSPAGLAYIGVSSKAWKAISKRRNSVVGWYTSLLLWKDMWVERKRPWFSYSVSLVFALRAVLDWIFEQGFESIFKRYEIAARAIRTGVLSMGLSLVPDCCKCAGCTSPKKICADTVTAIRYPDGVHHEEFSRIMNEKYRISVGGGLGKLDGKIFRVGPTGITQLIPWSIISLLASIGLAMENCGVKVKVDDAIRKAAETLAESP